MCCFSALVLAGTLTVVDDRAAHVSRRVVCRSGRALGIKEQLDAVFSKPSWSDRRSRKCWRRSRLSMLSRSHGSDPIASSICSDTSRSGRARRSLRWRGLVNADLDRIVPGRTYTFEVLLQGLVQHEAYLLGQIRLLCKP